MSNRIILIALGFSSVTWIACGGATPEPASTASTSGSSTTSSSAAATATAEDQVTVGGKLYGENCAKCHGAGGEGSTKAPPVVGKAALPLDPRPTAQYRKTKFHTAGDVLQFVKANMPPGKGGSLTDEQYEAIIAFDLKANGVDLSGKKIDATTAPSFVLHP